MQRILSLFSSPESWAIMNLKWIWYALKLVNLSLHYTTFIVLCFNVALFLLKFVLKQICRFYSWKKGPMGRA